LNKLFCKGSPVVYMKKSSYGNKDGFSFHADLFLILNSVQSDWIIKTCLIFHLKFCHQQQTLFALTLFTYNVSKWQAQNLFGDGNELDRRYYMSSTQ